MPITLSYDLQTDDPNHRSYVRSMFERFGWKRLGGSVLRYEKKGQEDWLNEVVPAIMFFRSYVLAHGINVSFFTLDAGSVTRVDFSDPEQTLGRQPVSGSGLKLHKPTNKQSSVKKIRHFVSSARKTLQ